MRTLQENEVLNGIYRIVREIGSGGMGVIYLAYHLNLEKYVVIKKIKDDFVGQLEARAEVDIMKNLRHSYIPQIYDFIQIGTDVYTVMNYIEGYDFAHYIRNGCWFTEEELTKWLMQSLQVLEYLHNQKPPIIHSDIKPANIMLDQNDDICVIDFNISFEQNQGKHIMAATAAYAPLEQLVPQDVYDEYYGYTKMTVIDERTDIYSLGATFYHIATHIKPNTEINSTYPITALDVPYSNAFTKVIWKAMQAVPENRYQSASEMLKAVRDIRKHMKEYKLIRAGIIACGCLVGFMVGCGGVMLYKQSAERKLKAFQAEYNRAIEISADYAPQEALEQAMYILNEEDYDKYFSDSPEKKGNLLYQIATAYYVQDNYDAANQYFEEALNYIDHSDCYRDYAISLAQSDNLEAALEFLSAYSAQMDSMDVMQVQAEIWMLQGDYEQAINGLQYVLDSSLNAEKKTRALVLLSEAYYNMGDFAGMEAAVVNVSLPDNYNITKYSILATAYIGLANEGSGTVKNEYYAEAQEYLEMLEDQGYLGLDDALNLVIVYQNQGEYYQAEQKLIELMADYPDNYRLYLQMCFLLYGRETEKNSEERNYSEFENYYIQTINIYNEQNTSGIEDDKIKQLKQLHQELKDKDYL